MKGQFGLSAPSESSPSRLSSATPRLPPPPLAGFVLFRGPGVSRRVLGFVSGGGGRGRTLARELPGPVVARAPGGNAVSSPLWQGGLWSSEIRRRECGEENTEDICPGTEFVVALCRGEVGRASGTRLPTQTLGTTGLPSWYLRHVSQAGCQIRT